MDAPYEHDPEIKAATNKLIDVIDLLTDDTSNVTQAFALFSDGVQGIAPILKAMKSETDKNAKLKIILKMIASATSALADEFIKDQPNTPAAPSK
jgi:hypothetical protein